MTPLKAIRAHCLECSGKSTNEVRLCPISVCPLFPYRLGHNPARAGIGNKRAKLPRKAELNKRFLR